MNKKINLMLLSGFCILILLFLWDRNTTNAANNIKTVDNGTYVIKSAIDNKYVL